MNTRIPNKRTVKRERQDNGQMLTSPGSGAAASNRAGSGQAARRTSAQSERSRQNQRESAFGQSPQLFGKVFQEAPIGMVLTNRDGQFISVNPAFCQMLGYTAEELTG